MKIPVYRKRGNGREGREPRERARQGETSEQKRASESKEKIYISPINRD